ncbi:MAG: cbb3-type cytochrome c oxidase subunit I [Akkermansiaceae bacterium]|jgi:cytochrome c oxidase cbb3-type subunit I/II
MTLTYDDQTPRHFMIASIVWGIVGMLVGVIIALQMGSWQMNGHFLEIITFGAFKTDGISWLTFGRLRPLHTNAVIFAFVGNMAFSGIAPPPTPAREAPGNQSWKSNFLAI